MKHNSLRRSSYAVLAALIWGTAFVAQSMAAGAVPSFAFNASRAVIAFAFLLVLCVVLQAVRRRQGKPVSTTRSKKDLLLGGLCCGVAMGLATYLQQKGLETTTSGKASFITTLYIVLIPIAGLFMKKRVPRTIWFSVALAVGMLVKKKLPFSIRRGDFRLNVQCKKFLSIGLPLALQEFLTQLSFLALCAFVNRLGLAASSG